MLPCVLGQTAEEAVRRLRDAGATVVLCPYSSKKGVPQSDCSRVVRQKEDRARRGGAGVIACKMAPFEQELFG